MSTVSKKELLNEAYDSLLIAGGAIALSMIAKKIVGMPLNTPEKLKGTAKLAAAVAVSTMAVKWAQDKKYLPVELLQNST